MKQKIVINVQMPCEKCKSKVMKIAVKADGVTKVEVQGDLKDKLVVIGEDVDSVKLTRSLRKKLKRGAFLLSVEEEKQKEKEKEKEKDPWLLPMSHMPYPTHHVLVYDPNPSDYCSIM